MAHEHKSGLSGAYDSSENKSEHTGVVFRDSTPTDGRFATSDDFNSAQNIARRRGQRIGNLIAKDGDRVEGCEAVVNIAGQTVTLTGGRLYVGGDVRPIAGAVLSSVPMDQDVTVGVRLTTNYEDEVSDPDLIGRTPGSESEGEPQMSREIETISWGFDGDGNAGRLYSVYLIRNGTIIDQTPPPYLSGINQAIAVYDYDAHENYIVDGCRVTALGQPVAGTQRFSIEAGRANILGFKYTRYTNLLHDEVEDPDVDQVDAEIHIQDVASPFTFTVRHGPINAISTILIDKEKSVSLTKGVTDSTDALPDSSVFEVVSVTQNSGSTVYDVTTDWVQNGDAIDWSPGGSEPAQGESYDVTYRYRDAISEDSFTDFTVTVSGGYNGGQVQITYNYKMPRIDLLCFDQKGGSVYVKGLSNKQFPIAPQTPASLAKICEINNTWIGNPRVTNNGTRNWPYTKIDRYMARVVDLLDLVGLERLRRDIDSREPVAKRGVFVDPFTNDRYRDSGEAQDAAVFEGSLQLAIDPTFYVTTFAEPITLDFTEEIHIDQPLNTQCRLINPFQNFDPLPAALDLTPSVDFWVERQTDFLSDVTQNFGTGQVVRTTTEVELVDEREELLEFLREINVQFTISGLAEGELLDTFSFGGVDIVPAGMPLAANAQGEITSTFDIPANQTAGTKAVIATTQIGRTAENVFVGQGVLEIETMRRTNMVFREPAERTFNDDPFRGGGGGGGGGGGDPIAQSYAPAKPVMVSSINIRFCALGEDLTNDVNVQIVSATDAGEDAVFPTRDVLAESFVDIDTVVIDQWHNCPIAVPLVHYDDRQYCFVVMTDDANHSIASARLGDIYDDGGEQKVVSGQPYTVGVMFTSSNSLSWNVHNDEDVTFQVMKAKFAPLSKTVVLGTFSVVNCSDLMVRAAVELPTGDADLYFEIERADATVYRLSPNQNLELDEYITEDVELRVVMTGSEDISPVLYPGVMLIAGSMRQTGTYISRAFTGGTAIRMRAFYKAWLPPGSTATISMDAADDSFTEMTLDVIQQLNDGWLEREHSIDPFTAEPSARIKIELTGTPGARPSLADLVAASI